MFTTGQRVRLIGCGRDVSAIVYVASANGRSLLLQFETIVCGCVGVMPVLWDDDGIWRCVITGDELMLTQIP